MTHEQALLCIAAYTMFRLARLTRSRPLRLGLLDAPWIAGWSAFIAWQVSCRIAVGEFPVFASGDASIDVPFRGLIQQSWYWTQNGFGRQEALVVPQAALLTVLVVLAWRRTAGLRAEDRWLPLALVAAGVLGVSVSKNVWVGPAELRQFVVLSTIAWLIIVMSKERIPRSLIAATTVVWLLTAALRVVAV